MRIGVIACGTIRREVARMVQGDPDVVEVVYLEPALHVHPERLRDAVLEQLRALEGTVDAVLLGYGGCGALEGIEDLASVPTVLPPHPDCLSILLTPERYAAEIAKEAGTWFMSPGWAEVTPEMLVEELRLDSVPGSTREPMELAERLFSHYRRGLFFNAGMDLGECEAFRERARGFCERFSLAFEEVTVPESAILREQLERCKRLARDARAAG